MTSNLTIADPRYLEHDGYPILEMEIDGRTARFCSGCKPTLFRAGYVFLGHEFSDLCPVVTFRPSDGAPLTLEAFTRDPVVYRLYDRFLRACADGTFTPGPVPIPE